MATFLLFIFLPFLIPRLDELPMGPRTGRLGSTPGRRDHDPDAALSTEHRPRELSITADWLMNCRRWLARFLAHPRDVRWHWPIKWLVPFVSAVITMATLAPWQPLSVFSSKNTARGWGRPSIRVMMLSMSNYTTVNMINFFSLQRRTFSCFDATFIVVQCRMVCYGNYKPVIILLVVICFTSAGSLQVCINFFKMFIGLM